MLPSNICLFKVNNLSLKMSFITDRSLLKGCYLKVCQKNDFEANMTFSKTLKLETLEIFVCQNAIPTILAYSEILKLHKFKTNVSLKKT